MAATAHGHAGIRGSQPLEAQQVEQRHRQEAGPPAVHDEFFGAFAARNLAAERDRMPAKVVGDRTDEDFAESLDELFGEDGLDDLL